MYVKLIPICFILIVALAPAEIGLAQSKPKLNVLLEEGQTQYRAQDFDASEDAFQRAMDVYPKSHLVHYWLGMVDYTRQEDEAALKHFKKVIRFKQKAPEGHIGAGMVHLRKTNYAKEAFEAFHTAEKVAPKNTLAPYYLGLAYIRQIKDALGLLYIKRARDAFRKVVKIEPDHPDAYYQLGRLEEFPNKDFDTAIELYDHQLRLNPIHREALERMVACHFFLERYQSAVDKLTALSHFHGDRASPRLPMIIAKCQAALYENQRQYGRALVVYWDRRGPIYIRYGEPDDRQRATLRATEELV